MLPLTRVLTLSRFYTSCLSCSPWIGFSRTKPSTPWTTCSSPSILCKYSRRFVHSIMWSQNSMLIGVESYYLINVDWIVLILRSPRSQTYVSINANCIFVWFFLGVCGFKIMSHYEAAIFTARRLEMCEIVEMTLFYFLDRPMVHSPLSGLPFMVGGFDVLG